VNGAVDAVLLCNVLHQVPLAERAPVLEGAFQLVRPGGWVGANTLFYDGGVEPGTRLFYTRWLVQARRQLANASVRWVPPRHETPVALQRLSAQQHHDLFEKLGYQDIHVEELQFDWSPEDWEALCHYSVFIHGALSPDIPLETGRQALIDSLHHTYRTLGIPSVRRGWLHVAARRPAS
jgi:hypothetical protein